MRIKLYALAAAIAAPLAWAQEQPTDAGFWPIPNPWTSEAEPPPPPRPYKLPRFESHTEEQDHYTPVKPLQTAPALDVEGLYYSVLSCYPEPSKFRLELDLETRYANRRTYDLTGTDIGQHYIGIVARMPLYSATELNREREREYKRRTETAATIGKLMQALAKRNHAAREMGLYSSLEARSQVRVMQGVADTAEQVKYLEKVASTQVDLIQTETDLIEHRLALVSQCADDRAAELNAYIKRLTALPRRAAQ